MAEGIINNFKCKSESKRRNFRKKDTDYNSNFNVRRRVPPRPGKEKNDIFVSSKSDFREQLSHCMKLVEDGEVEVSIYALGATIPKAINLGLQLHERLMGTFGISTSTNSIDISDDLEPVDDMDVGDSRVKSHSTVHILLHKIIAEAE